MKKQLVAIPESATGNQMVAATAPTEPTGFIDTTAFLKLVPVSRATLGNWMRDGKIPYIKNGGRRVLFDWPTVREALLRKQRGGVE